MGTAAMFLRWTFARAVLHWGYVLTSGLWFVTGAHLTAGRLVALGAVVALTMTLTDVPAGVFADAAGRKWPLVAGHAFLAAAMVATAFARTFPQLVVTQILWGLGWAFSGGADVAWLTDEGRPDDVDRVLAARARWEVAGDATGTVAFGVLAATAGLRTAILISGVAMAATGVFVAVRFPGDTPARRDPAGRVPRAGVASACAAQVS